MVNMGSFEANLVQIRKKQTKEQRKKQKRGPRYSI